MNIAKPTLLVDQKKCLQNIQRMAEKANQSEAELRPHFKTHHSAEIGNWFREFGVNKCTVSSVEMASYFAEHGWDDITIAFPFNPLESDQISEIAKKCQLNILIESIESQQLANERITGKVHFFIKVDVGYHRTGIDPTNDLLIQQLISASTDKVSFEGFIAHAGHTYGSNKTEIENIFHHSEKVLRDLKKKYGGVISYGDTPSCSIMNDFSSFDEIRAGNYAFYDWMQKSFGSCAIEDIAVCLACPVVAVHKDRNEVVVFGGAVHLSKDRIMENNVATYGKAVKLNSTGWDLEIIGNVQRISQEHGVIQMANQNIAHVKVGDLIGVIPIHSCLTADLQGHYYSTKGQKIEKIVKE